MIDPTAQGQWKDLNSKLRPFVARRVHTDDVDDVLQEIFLRIQTGLSSLRNEQRFGAWVYQVARSAVVDHLRSAARHPPTPTPTLAHSSSAPFENNEQDEVVDDRSAEREIASYIALFIAMLPSPYREALTLTDLEGLTQKAAAEMLGISVSGMKSRVQRGREKLRTSLEDCCDIALDPRRRVMDVTVRPDGKFPDKCCK